MRKLISFGEALPLLALLLIAAVLALFGRWVDFAIAMIGTIACIYYTVNGVRERIAEMPKKVLVAKPQAIATLQPVAAVVKAAPVQIVTQPQPVTPKTSGRGVWKSFLHRVTVGNWYAWKKFRQGIAQTLEEAGQVAEKQATMQAGGEEVAAKTTAAVKTFGDFLQKKAVPYLLKRPRILFALGAGLWLLLMLTFDDGFPLISILIFCTSLVFLLKKERQTKDTIARGAGKLLGLAFSKSGVYIFAFLAVFALVAIIAEGTLNNNQAFLLALVAYVIFFLPASKWWNEKGDTNK